MNHDNQSTNRSSNLLSTSSNLGSNRPHYTSYADHLQIELLRYEVMQWKRLHREALWQVDELKNDNCALDLRLSIWKARYMNVKTNLRDLERTLNDLQKLSPAAFEQEEEKDKTL